MVILRRAHLARRRTYAIRAVNIRTRMYTGIQPLREAPGGDSQTAIPSQAVKDKLRRNRSAKQNGKGTRIPGAVTTREKTRKYGHSITVNRLDLPITSVPLSWHCCALSACPPVDIVPIESDVGSSPEGQNQPSLTGVFYEDDAHLLCSDWLCGGTLDFPATASC